MKEFAIFVLCYAGDFHLTKCLCQSIRYFCGDVPIVLLKDGNFDTSQLYKLGHICEYDRACSPAPLRKLKGWGVNKLHAFFQQEYERFLYLDSDIALVGNVLRLPFRTADFYVDTAGMRPIVAPGEKPTPWVKRGKFPRWVKPYTFDPEKIVEFDPDFNLDKVLLFNSGQMFARPGLLDLDQVLDCLEHWNKNAGLFLSPDQGILNYLLNKGHQQGRWTLDGEPFRIGGSYETPRDFPALTHDKLLMGDLTERALIHWAGVSHYRLGDYTFAFVLREFQNQYYRHFPFWTRWLDEAKRLGFWVTQQIHAYAYALQLKLRLSVRGN